MPLPEPSINPERPLEQQSGEAGTSQPITVEISQEISTGATGPYLPSAPATAPSIPGYQIISEIGRGGMGVVYRARNLSSGSMVALKTLPRTNPSAIYRFKQEFRTLVGLTHPNLVPLYELIHADGTWCLTMEWVQGINLRDYAKQFVLDGHQPDYETIRGLMAQLARGIRALHRVGILHRDIKPSNVLVRQDGQVILIDFGLAAELDTSGLYKSSTGQISGTLSYMAPEQAAGEAISSAADWYAFGVVLYELMTGKLPFMGTVHQVIERKLATDPVGPSSLRPDVPTDLDGLCRELLSRDPAIRPDGYKILQQFGVTEDAATSVVSGIELTGRMQHVQILRRALATSQTGKMVCVHIHGPSGAGKSTLTRALSEQIKTSGAVILAGRSYDQELVPFNAFDGVVDSLTNYLMRLSDSEVAALLPRDVEPLLRLFPILSRVPVIASATSGRVVADAREARRRGVMALRELLTRLADRRPVVIITDDLQWGDADSGIMLEELVRLPEPPSLLLLLSYRRGNSDSIALETAKKMTSEGTLEVIDLPVDPLEPEDATRLAQQLLGESIPSQAEQIAREAQGNPFYIVELAAAARAGRIHSGKFTLDQVVWDRICEQSTDARQLLEVLATAGRPVSWTVAQMAAGPASDFSRAQVQLRSLRLARAEGGSHGAPYHDRVREIVLARIDPETRRQHHLNLAHAARDAGETDPEFLAVHWHGGGDYHAAAVQYAAAGVIAANSTAFDRAAELYRLAAEIGDWSPQEKAQLLADQAEALANAGRGAAAAETYLFAAKLVDANTAIEWKRCAAEQYLICGHFDVGLSTLKEVVKAVGLWFPGTPTLALLGILWLRFRLRLRGLAYKIRNEQEIAAKDLRRIDVCWSAATGLSTTHYVFGAYFQSLGLIHALNIGESGRLARFLAYFAASLSAEGPKQDLHVSKMMHLSQYLAEIGANQRAIATVQVAKGMTHFLTGRYRRASVHFDKSNDYIKLNCVGVNWETNISAIWGMLSLVNVGEFNRLFQEWPTQFASANYRDDLYAKLYVGLMVMANLRIAKNEINQALSELNSYFDMSDKEYPIKIYVAMDARVVVSLYIGDGIGAWTIVENKEKQYRNDKLWLVQQIKVYFLQLRARAALAASRQTNNPKAFLRSAERDARKLQREHAEWSQALGALMSACVLASQNPVLGPIPFEQAADKLEAVELGVFAASARYRQGERTPGQEGQTLRESAIAWLASQGVVKPLRMIQSHAPLTSDTNPD